VNENCVSLLTEFFASRHSLIKSGTCQLDGEPFASMSLDVVNFELGSCGRHEYGSLDLKLFAAVGDTLGMVASTACADSSFSLLFCKPSKSICGPSYFKATDWLQILSFEIDFSLILGGEEVGLLKLGSGDDGPALAVRLVYFVGGNDIALVILHDIDAKN